MRALRVALLIAGTAGMAYAVFGVLTDGGTEPLHQALFLVALLIAHDGILLPLALGVGVLTVRFVPRRVRGAIQAGLYASAVVTLLAIPFLVGAGRDPGNISILPLDYGHGLLYLLAGIWLAVLAVAVTSRTDRTASTEDR